MYAIMSDGKIVSMCDKPLYVKKNSNGIYVEASKKDATHVSVKGDLYSLSDDDSGLPKAVVVQIDMADFIFQNTENLENVLKEAINDVE